ncbi:hypothetical protein M1534_00940 [Patescibacteria group bacterium]|nr:hypothetical protein [Patescibacteria group bacterium]
MPQKNSTQYFLPLQDIRDGVVVLKTSGLRAVLACSSLNFDLKSEEEQNAIIYQYQDFLNSLDFTLQIIVQSRILNLENYIRNLQDINASQDNPLLQIQTNEYVEFIKSLVEVENIMSKSFYIVVPFDPPAVPGKTSITSFIKPSSDTTLSDADFVRYKDQLWQRVEHIVIGLNSVGVRAINLNTPELIELFYNLYNPQPFSRKPANLDQWAEEHENH